jgi:hypothetical protein
MEYVQGTSTLWETPLLSSRGCERSGMVSTIDHSVLQALCHIGGCAFSIEERRDASDSSTYYRRDGLFLAMPSGEQGIAPPGALTSTRIVPALHGPRDQ